MISQGIRVSWKFAIIYLIIWVFFVLSLNWGTMHGYFGYKTDNQEKEQIILSQIPKMVSPYHYDKEQLFVGKKGPRSIVRIGPFPLFNKDEIDKFFKTIDNNTQQLGFEKGCRGNESIIVDWSTNPNYNPHTGENFYPWDLYIEWNYPSSYCK